MIANENQLVTSTPRLIDEALQPFNVVLKANVSWLSNCYGMAHTRYKDAAQGSNSATNRRKHAFPAVPGEKTEYINLFPDEHLKSFSFFVLENGMMDVEYTSDTNSPKIEATLGMVVWYDLRDIYGAQWATNSVQNVVRDLMQVLRTLHVVGLYHSWYKVAFDKNRVYSGFSVGDIDEVAFMRPKGCFKLIGDIIYKETC